MTSKILIISLANNKVRSNIVKQWNENLLSIAKQIASKTTNSEIYWAFESTLQDTLTGLLPNSAVDQNIRMNENFDLDMHRNNSDSSAQIKEYYPFQMSEFTTLFVDILQNMNPKFLLISHSGENLNLRDIFGVECYMIASQIVPSIQVFQSDYFSVRNSDSSFQSGEFAPILKQSLASRVNLTLVFDQDSKFDVCAVTAEGSSIKFPIGKEIQHHLISFIMTRENVTWFKTDSKPFNSRPVVDKSNEETASRLLEFAQNAKLLTSTPGNISFRGNEKSVNFLVTPRKVNKSQVRTDQLVYVSSDLNTYKNVCWSPIDAKSSIDSGVQAIIYDRIPKLSGFVHFHYNEALIFATHGTTSFPFPCGCVEEGEEICSLLVKSQIRGSYESDQSFSVELKDHGWLLGFVENDLQVCMKDWFRLIEISNAKVNNLFPNISKNSYPIFVGNKIIGVLNVFKQEDLWITALFFDQDPSHLNWNVLNCFSETLLKRNGQNICFLGASTSIEEAWRKEFEMNGWRVVKSLKGKSNVDLFQSNTNTNNNNNFSEITFAACFVKFGGKSSETQLFLEKNSENSLKLIESTITSTNAQNFTTPNQIRKLFQNVINSESLYHAMVKPYLTFDRFIWNQNTKRQTKLTVLVFPVLDNSKTIESEKFKWFSLSAISQRNNFTVSSDVKQVVQQLINQ